VPTSERHISSLLEPYVGPYLAKEPVKTMKEFKIPVRQFDLESFYKKTIEFIDNNFTFEFDSSFFILPVVEPNSQPYDVPEEGWDALGALQRGEYLAFFPLALADDEFTSCADGPVVKHSEEEAQGGLFLTMTDTCGSLLQINAGHTIMNSAVFFSRICPGPPPSIAVEPSCRSFDETMRRDIGEFLICNRWKTSGVTEDGFTRSL